MTSAETQTDYTKRFEELFGRALTEDDIGRIAAELTVRDGKHVASEGDLGSQLASLAEEYGCETDDIHNIITDLAAEEKTRWEQQRTKAKTRLRAYLLAGAVALLSIGAGLGFAIYNATTSPAVRYFEERARAKEVELGAKQTEYETGLSALADMERRMLHADEEVALYKRRLEEEKERFKEKRWQWIEKGQLILGPCFRFKKDSMHGKFFSNGCLGGEDLEVVISREPLPAGALPVQTTFGKYRTVIRGSGVTVLKRTHRDSDFFYDVEKIK